MFQPLKGHCQGDRTVTGTYTYMYTCNASVRIHCKVMYEDSGVRDMNFLLFKSVHTFIFFGKKYDDPVSAVM